MPKKVISVNNLVAQRIKHEAELAGFSHTKIGQLTGYSQSAISRILKGKLKLDIDKLAMFSKVLDKPVHYFLGNLPEN
jgi:transcriptional regulator with XRE-family HTH domain